MGHEVEKVRLFCIRLATLRVMYSLKAILSTALLLSTASAATISSSENFAATLLGPNGRTFTSGVTKFDATLGTLTGAVATFSILATGTSRVESLDNVARTVTLTPKIVAVNTLGGLSLGDINTSTTRVFNFSAYDGTTDFGGNSGSTVTGLSLSGSNPLNLVNFLSSLTGTGSAGFAIALTDQTTQAGATNASIQDTFNVSGSVSVTYTYTDASAVPEPSSMALMGLGAAALLGLRLKKR